MGFLGICKDTNTVYEGKSSDHAVRVQPTPILTAASIHLASDDNFVAESTRNSFASVFREDSFDPISQIRRGRLYKAWDAQNTAATVYHAGGESGSPNCSTIYVNAYIPFPAVQIMRQAGSLQNLKIILGADDYFTIWDVLAIEKSFLGDELVTLRSARSLNHVPDLNAENVPSELFTALDESLAKVRGSVNKQGAEAVIDRTRDTLSVVFSFLAGKPSADLSSAIKSYKSKNGGVDDMLSFCGHIVARLHSRVKPNEQKKRGLRAVNEADAQLAIYCLNFVLKEKEWVH